MYFLVKFSEFSYFYYSNFYDIMKMNITYCYVILHVPTILYPKIDSVSKYLLQTFS